MLSLTRKTEYALIALSHLSEDRESLASAREIADEYHMPLPVLTNILKTLNRAGVVVSVRGAKGGYRLACDPDDMTLAELIRVVEGPVHFVKCSGGGKAGTGDPPCELMAWCPVRPAALRVHRRFQQFLDEVTLGEMFHEKPRASKAATR